MRFLVFTLSILFSIGALAQQAIVTSGGDAVGSGGSVSFSIGQVSYSDDTEGTIHEGVQQPYEIYSVSVQESLLDLRLNLYPNPALHELIIEVPNFKAGLTATIHNSNGQLAERVRLTSSRTTISVVDWAASTYVIHVEDESGNSANYKLVKH